VLCELVVAVLCCRSCSLTQDFDPHHDALGVCRQRQDLAGLGGRAWRVCTAVCVKSIEVCIRPRRRLFRLALRQKLAVPPTSMPSLAHASRVPAFHAYSYWSEGIQSGGWTKHATAAFGYGVQLAEGRSSTSRGA
jgi:hypothetical protein